MAMPPDGKSAWAHHDDNWVLSDERGIFASLIVEVAGGRASVVLPIAGSSNDFFPVLGFVPHGDAIDLERYESSGPVGGRWTSSSTLALIPDAYREVRAQSRSGGRVEDGTILAILRVSERGAIELVDQRGRARLSVERVESASPGVHRGTGRTIDACGDRVRFFIADHPGTRVDTHASSLP